MTATRTVYLISWTPDALEALAGAVRAAGHDVVGTEATDGGRAYAQIGKLAPQVVVVDLGRRPSHGRATAESLRGRASTRDTELVFVGGDPARLERVREAFADDPAATFVDGLDALLARLAGP